MFLEEILYGLLALAEEDLKAMSNVTKLPYYKTTIILNIRGDWYADFSSELKH